MKIDQEAKALDRLRKVLDPMQALLGFLVKAQTIFLAVRRRKSPNTMVDLIYMAPQATTAHLVETPTEDAR